MSVARTGTNHLSKVLSNIPEIESRRELFNPSRIWRMDPPELEEFSRRLGRPLTCAPDNQQTVDAVRRNPGLTLECLLDLMPPEKRILTFKVFVNQLSVRQVNKAIISRSDSIIVFIRRRPIDVYVSQRKAARLNQWTKVDTTDMKVSIDPRHFLKWSRRCNDWYRRLEAVCWAMGKPFYQLTYETDLAASPLTVAGRFCAILEDCGLGPFTLPPDDPALGMTRQDRNKDVSDRVANWPEFKRYLTEKGLLERAFEPIPQFHPTKWDRLWRRLVA
ncbi:sulfotransferase [Dongia deserti]|uniref:sulfotransferase n=1 Tax=Dongia deserti TaxID=2268030 RepID=UPI0013C4E7AD|nr:sulfotransferase [Dongia deserti]